MIGLSASKVDAVASEMKVLFAENPELGKACSFQLRGQSSLACCQKLCLPVSDCFFVSICFDFFYISLL